jgi:hypothetical protein
MILIYGVFSCDGNTLLRHQREKPLCGIPGSSVGVFTTFVLDFLISLHTCLHLRRTSYVIAGGGQRKSTFCILQQLVEGISPVYLEACLAAWKFCKTFLSLFGN